jgi:hypothetical protein
VLSVKQFLAKKPITEMQHAPYYPDLALNDFWLFPKIKSALKDEDIKMRAIPEQEFSKKMFPTLTASWG